MRVVTLMVSVECVIGRVLLVMSFIAMSVGLMWRGERVDELSRVTRISKRTIWE
jgi:hypothetical protein